MSHLCPHENLCVSKISPCLCSFLLMFSAWQWYSCGVVHLPQAITKSAPPQHIHHRQNVSRFLYLPLVVSQ